jgi:hypothetical protein
MRGVIALRQQAIEPAERGPVISLDAEHLAQEAGVVAHLAEDHRAQRLHEAGLALDALEIEQHVAQLHRDLAARPDPARDLLAPLATGLAPHRVDRHDPAAAQREAQLIHVRRHARGELDEVRVDAAVLGIRVVGEHEAVVLVREQVALTAPARAHHDHGECDRRRPPALALHGIEVELHDATVDVVVDVRDQALDLRRRHAVGEQVGGEPHLRRLGLAQPIQRGLVGQLVDVLDQAGVSGGERIVQVHHAGQTAARLDHRHVAQAEAAHEPDRLVQRLVGRDGGDRARHELRDRLRSDRLSRDPAGDVLLGEDAGDPAVRARDHRRRGARLGHARDHLERGLRPRHHHRRRLHVIAHPAPERCRLGVRHVLLIPRVPQGVIIRKRRFADNSPCLVCME